MGADIYFDVNGKEVYFRDSYNEWNLAWVIGLSYWRTENRLGMMKKLSKITNKKIHDYVNSDKFRSSLLRYSNINQKNVKEHIKNHEIGLKQSRDELKRIFAHKNVKITGWSV